MVENLWPRSPRRRFGIVGANASGSTGCSRRKPFAAGTGDFKPGADCTTQGSKSQNEPNCRGCPSMTTFRQIEANRRNALKSTGPATAEGKQRSRCNAVRHGLTAETVIGALEDADDYKAFEAAIIADYDAQSAVERELVLRLASLLWRLRRATTMETGLFDIQADHLHEFRQARKAHPDSRTVVQAMFGRPDSVEANPDGGSHDSITDQTRAAPSPGAEPVDPAADLARCFLRLANLPNYALDRLSRYEATLWRQAGQILCALHALDRRKPQHRIPIFRSNTRQPGDEDGCQD
jgi:hypothetical protein